MELHYVKWYFNDHDDFVKGSTLYVDDDNQEVVITTLVPSPLVKAIEIPNYSHSHLKKKT